MGARAGRLFASEAGDAAPHSSHLRPSSPPPAQDSSRAARLAPIHRFFLFLPFEHAEDLGAQERAVALYAAEAAAAAAGGGDKTIAGALGMGLKYAESHRDVIARWGRFPHRNAVVGRESTAEEAAGLADGSIPKF